MDSQTYDRAVRYIETLVEGDAEAAARSEEKFLSSSSIPRSEIVAVKNMVKIQLLSSLRTLEIIYGKDVAEQVHEDAKALRREYDEKGID